MGTYLPGLLYSLLGLVETGCLIYLLYYYFNISIHIWKYLLVLFIVTGIIYLLNILSLFIQTVFLLFDTYFAHWIKVPSNRCFFIFATFISTIINYKFRMILFSKLFQFQSLSAMLDNIYKFRIFNVFSFFGILLESLALYVCFMEIPHYPQHTIIFYAFLDVIIIFFINIFFSILVVWKPNTFFEEKTKEGFITNRKISNIK